VSILGAAELKAPVRHVMHKPRRPIDWLPVPLRGHKCTLTVLLSESAVPVGDWERVIRQGDLTCGHLDLGPRGRSRLAGVMACTIVRHHGGDGEVDPGAGCETKKAWVSGCHES
jgi:hypothetical protein